MHPSSFTPLVARNLSAVSHRMKFLRRNLIPVLLALGIIPCDAAGNDWMRVLDGRLRLSELSIPGTHDAGARFEPLPGTARCQSLTIAEQLASGVRFLDIRCRHLNDQFAIYHGIVDQQLRFEEVLGATRDFLKANPSECVVMSILEESSASGATRSFEATFASYVAADAALWSLGDGIPALDQVRGKIVLLRRFRANAPPLGIDASRWPDNSSFTSGRIKVQDIYRVQDNEAKWKVLSALLEDAKKGDPEILSLNFASGVSSTFGIPNIKFVSDDMNARITKHFTASPRGITGIIVMDFADAARCALIYGSNPGTK